MTIKLIDILSEEVSSKVLTEQSYPKAPCPIIGYHVVYPFGYKRKSGRRHKGVDLPCPVGTPVYAPEDGVVRYAINDNQIFTDIEKPNSGDFCGRRVSIKHTKGILNGLRTVYCHLSKINVTKGQTVKKGDLIGFTGGEKGSRGSGNTDGPHLHLGLTKGGDWFDPQDYIQSKTSSYDMFGTQSSQQPMSQDYEDNASYEDNKSAPLPPPKQYQLSMDSFNEFVEDTFPQERKDEIESVNLEMLDGNMYFVIYRKNNKPDMFYLFSNGTYKLQNI